MLVCICVEFAKICFCVTVSGCMLLFAFRDLSKEMGVTLIFISLQNCQFHHRRL